MHKKTIDPITGRMFLKHTVQDDLRDKRVREKQMVKRKAEGIAPLRTEKDWDEDDIDETRERMIRELNLDVTYAEFPSKERREWSIAQAHLIKQRVMGKDGEFKDGEEMPGKDELHEMNVLDDVGDEMSAEMHQNVIDKLQSREPLYQS